MSRYARLQELGFETDDSELFEVGEVGSNPMLKVTDGEPVVGHSFEDERALQRKSIRDHIYTVPSTEILNSKKLQYSKGCSDNCGALQQQQEKHDTENCNPNVRSIDPTTRPTVVAICSHTSSSTSSGSSQEQRGSGVRVGVSVRSRRTSAEERSRRCPAGVCESYQRDNAASGSENDSIKSNAPPSRPSCGQWTLSTQRGTPYREREPVIDRQSRETISSKAGTVSEHPQGQDKQFCTSRSSCNDVRSCLKFSEESSPREGHLNDDPVTGPEMKGRPSVVQYTSDASYGGCFSEERNPTLQRNGSARAEPGLHKSSSTRDTPGHPSEMCIENWKDHPASRSAHVSEKTTQRVNFTLTENHELEAEKLREKWREPTSRSKNVLQEKKDTNQQPLRYNYEQPGFVEHEKENICGGRSYTMYGVKEMKECPKGSAGRHQQLLKAFSVRENNSNYRRIPRAYSVNSVGRHVTPTECEACGMGGIGVVVLGLPGNETSFCKACNSRPGWSCSDGKPPKKKKSIMEYCRKLLRLPQKLR